VINLIRKFAATPFSGYLAIGLLVAAAGAGYWFWSELKEFGGLEQRAEAQEETIAIQNARLEQLARLNDERQAALSEQVTLTQRLERNERMYRLAIQEARKNASKALKECMDMHIADGMSFGPSAKSKSADG